MKEIIAQVKEQELLEQRKLEEEKFEEEKMVNQRINVDEIGMFDEIDVKEQQPQDEMKKS